MDGKHDLAELEPGIESDRGLTPEERTEMLLHRCFVTTTKQHHDQWPYYDKLRVEVP